MFIQPDQYIRPDVLDLIDDLAPTGTTDHLTILRTIAFYPMPSSAVDIPHWLLYRIFNIVKSIFDQSDWQISRKFFAHSLMAKTGIPIYKSNNPIYTNALKEADRIINGLINTNLYDIDDFNPADSYS